MTAHHHGSLDGRVLFFPHGNAATLLPDKGVVTGMGTLDPYIVRYLTERKHRGELTESTVADLRSRLHSLSDSFGGRPLTHLSERAIERWQGTIGHMRPSSRRAYLSTIRRFCKWMVRRRYIKTDPTAELTKIAEPRTEPRALGVRQVHALLTSRPDARSQVILWLMLGIGLRCCEVAGLTIDDYDTIALTMFVRGKGSHERILPVPSILTRKLDVYIAAEGLTGGPLVRSVLDPSRGLSPASVSILVTGWMWDCGIKKRPRDRVSAHALRHTCLSDVADKEPDLRVVQELGGHANLATVSVYQRRMGLERMREAVEGRTYLDAVA